MKPLAGVKVLDLTHVLAGPFCTYQLATLGASVIKIESHERPDMMLIMGPDFASAHRSMGLHYQAQAADKQSLCLNLDHAEACDILRRLVATADVLVENYRSGILEQRGLGFAALSEINPLLIHCSITGYGQTGPKAQHPAYDNVIQAFSGLMAATGTVATGPIKIGPPVLDYGTGVQAALAVTAALLQRGQTGVGQQIDVAMLDAALMLMTSSVVETLDQGAAPGPAGNSSSAAAGYGCFETQEGLLMLGAYTAQQQALMWRVLDEPELADEVASMTPVEMMHACDVQAQRLQQRLRLATADTWETRFNENGVPAARVRTLDETLASEQVASRRVIQQVANAATASQSLSVTVAAFGYLHDGPSVSRAPPELGADTAQILGGLGYTESEIGRLRERGIV